MSQTSSRVGWNGGLGGIAVDVAQHCRKCGAKLILEEMHYYDQGDGTATCAQCEGDWCGAVEAWRHGAAHETRRSGTEYNRRRYLGFLWGRVGHHHKYRPAG